MTSYLVELRADVDSNDIDARALERLAARALETERAEQPGELSIVLAGDEAVRELNRAYRSVDAATDVLSFGQADGEAFARPPGAPRHLGDVVISVDTARRQALEYGLPLQDEVAHLLVHGILHLLGHDHESSDEAAAIMRAREAEILGRGLDEVHGKQNS